MQKLDELYQLAEHHLSLQGQEAFQILVDRNDVRAAKILLLGAIFTGQTDILILPQKVVDALLNDVGISLEQLNASMMPAQNPANKLWWSGRYNKSLK